jgi:phospholipid/cholesterol/gamma-HCH transport system ATP-binding protein
VREIMHTLPPAAQEAIRDDLEGTHKYAANELGGDTVAARHWSTEPVGAVVTIPESTPR